MSSTSNLFLPSEVLGHIVQYAGHDLPTLAQLSRVSLACLELASPLLYDIVTVTREDQYESLFCTDTTSLSDQISPYLSLRQIHHLSLLVPPPSNVVLHPSSRLLAALGPLAPSPPSQPSTYPRRRSPSPLPTNAIRLTSLTLCSDPESNFAPLISNFSPIRLIIAHDCPGAPLRQQRVEPEPLTAPGSSSLGPNSKGLIKVLQAWSVGRRLEEVVVEDVVLGVGMGGGSMLVDHWTTLLRDTYILHTHPSLIFTFRFSQPLAEDGPRPIERFGLRMFGRLAEQAGKSVAVGEERGRPRLRLEFLRSEGMGEDEVGRRAGKVRACFNGGFEAGVWVGVV